MYGVSNPSPAAHKLVWSIRAHVAQSRRKGPTMSDYIDTYALLKSRADKELRAKLERDADYPRGPAGRVIALNHMRNGARYSPEQIEQAKAILVAENIS